MAETSPKQREGLIHKYQKCIGLIIEKRQSPHFKFIIEPVWEEHYTDCYRLTEIF